MKLHRQFVPLFQFAFLLLSINFWSPAARCQTITGLDPSSAAAHSGDTIVTINGTDFTKDTKVYGNCSHELPIKNPNLSDSQHTSVQVTLPKEALAEAGGILITVTQKPCDPSSGSFFVVVANPIRQASPIGQSLVGVDISAASSTDPQAVFLGTASLDVPFRSRADIEQVHPWFGGELKIAGMAQPGSLSNLSTQAAFAGYLASAANATPDKIVQSAEVSANLSYKIAGGWRIHTGVFDSGTKPSDPLTLLTVSVIIQGGAITPLSASQANPPVYLATQQIQNTFPNPTNFPYASSCKVAQGATPTCFVAFIPFDRSHFYRHYEGGFRFKIYGEDNDDHILRYPGTFDVIAGQNEYVTGGQFHGAVLHIGGSLPIPVLDGFYGFGGMDLALSNQGNAGTQLLLVPAPASNNVTFTSPSVYTISVGQPNRDRYTLGFGIDLFHLYQSVKQKTQAAKTQQNGAQPNP